METTRIGHGKLKVTTKRSTYFITQVAGVVASLEVHERRGNELAPIGRSFFDLKDAKDAISNHEIQQGLQGDLAKDVEDQGDEAAELATKIARALTERANAAHTADLNYGHLGDLTKVLVDLGNIAEFLGID